MNPIEADRRMLELAEEQSRLSEELAILEENKLRHFNQFRTDYKSDKACENSWLGSDEGILHMRKTMRLKAIAKEISVYKVHIRHSENIARNLY